MGKLPQGCLKHSNPFLGHKVYVNNNTRYFIKRNVLQKFMIRIL